MLHSVCPKTTSARITDPALRVGSGNETKHQLLKLTRACILVECLDDWAK